VSDKHPLESPGAFHLDPLTLYHQDIVTVTRVSGKRPWKPQHVGLPANAKLSPHYRDDEQPEQYDEIREGTDKWKRETELVTELLQGFQPGTTVLDCPVGTGRFIELYEGMGFHVLGVDKSDAMLRQAQAKSKSDNSFFRTGDATDLGDVGHFDVSLCIRLFRWISSDDVIKVLKELQRVTLKRIIINARTDPAHPYSRPRSLIESALDGWAITVAREIEPGFEMFAIERV
jgi:hypothetical protein